MDVINLMKIFEENTKILQKQLHYNVKNFSSMSSYAAACAMFKDRSICFNIDSKQVLDAVENTVHGGFAHVYTRKAIKSDIDKELKIDGGHVQATILFVDENNMYGGKMCQKLCQGIFFERENSTPDDVNEFLESYHPDDFKGCLVQCDLHLPREHHNGNESL